MMWGSVANVNSLYSHRVLRWDTSTGVIPSSTAQSYPLRQPGEMCARSLSRISKIRSGPPLGGWFLLFNKIAKTQTGPARTRSKKRIELKSDRLTEPAQIGHYHCHLSKNKALTSANRQSSESRTYSGFSKPAFATDYWLIPLHRQS